MCVCVYIYIYVIIYICTYSMIVRIDMKKWLLNFIHLHIIHILIYALVEKSQLKCIDNTMITL